MRPHTRTIRALTVALLAALALPSPAAFGAADDAPTAAKPLPALTPAGPDALSRALAGGRIDEATYALERVAALFAPASVRARYGDVGSSDPRGATLLFRDLAIRAHALTGPDRARAIALLARPTQGGQDPEDDGYSVGEETPVCSTEVCVHYVASTPDAPPTLDEANDGVPDWVATTASVMDEVWSEEIDRLGYREPKSDVTSKHDGGNGKLDVYLSDIGGKGLYGYCTSDDPNANAGYRYYDLSAYCVLDDDYALDQFGYADPMDPLTVTAAHEFHHAVQFAYDAYEDGWIMEASSTWIEDEVYDDVDDNVQYLQVSPLSQPHVPVDRSTAMEWYGAWIFMRFLSEYVGLHDGGPTQPDPSIVRSIWARLDGAAGGTDQYSTKGVNSAISSRTLGGAPGKLRRVFADFAAWNARPVAFYDEGASYFAADNAASKTLTGSARSYSSVASIDHLANRFVSLTRGAGLAGDAKLKITVDGPDAATSPAVTAVVLKASGGVAIKRVALDSSGRGSVTVAFGSTVSRVVVIATNSSARYSSCWTNQTVYACFGGTPLDENRRFDVRAAVV